LVKQLHPFFDCRRWWIAYSGGVDSHVLLHLLVQLRKQQKIPALTAIHINHQLNPKAHEWVVHCRGVCADLDVEFIAEAVSIENHGDGIEAAARKARYAVFEKLVGENELLLQAHHRDDQIETLMLRLLRGSGVAGLAAIPGQRELGAGQLLRPLLNYSRADVLAYAEKKQLQWIEDDSNQSDRFDRNFLRLNVLPVVEQRWPSYRHTLARVVMQADESTQLLDDLAHLDAVDAIAIDGTLSLAACERLSEARQSNLLRFWLQQKKLPQPSREQLRQVLAMARARIDAQPCVTWPGVEVHRFRDMLYALPPLPPVPAEPIDVAWDLSQPLNIEGLGTLTATSVVGSGLRADLHYRVRNRLGGERCKPSGRAHSQTVKKLLQEYAVPPWLRDCLPIIYCGDEIAAVADLWVCEGFASTAVDAGWRVDWQL
ncbi:MAG TPA: tRNA lysidine(34) synthetase TilS, partial [Spongiibacteraceae bacterium]|nr:tRNA lysidine(34) synthetase TilS [Spongiibacteraceae bacterium]